MSQYANLTMKIYISMDIYILRNGRKVNVHIQCLNRGYEVYRRWGDNNLKEENKMKMLNGL